MESEQFTLEHVVDAALKKDIIRNPVEVLGDQAIEFIRLLTKRDSHKAFEIVKSYNDPVLQRAYLQSLKLDRDSFYNIESNYILAKSLGEEKIAANILNYWIHPDRSGYEISNCYEHLLKTKDPELIRVRHIFVNYNPVDAYRVGRKYNDNDLLSMARRSWIELISSRWLELSKKRDSDRHNNIWNFDKSIGSMEFEIKENNDKILAKSLISILLEMSKSLNLYDGLNILEKAYDLACIFEHKHLEVIRNKLAQTRSQNFLRSNDKVLARLCFEQVYLKVKRKEKLYSIHGELYSSALCYGSPEQVDFVRNAYVKEDPNNAKNDGFRNKDEKIIALANVELEKLRLKEISEVVKEVGEKYSPLFIK